MLRLNLLWYLRHSVQDARQQIARVEAKAKSAIEAKDRDVAELQHKLRLGTASLRHPTDPILFPCPSPFFTCRFPLPPLFFAVTEAHEKAAMEVEAARSAERRSHAAELETVVEELAKAREQADRSDRVAAHERARAEREVDRVVGECRDQLTSLESSAIRELQAALKFARADKYVTRGTMA